MSQLKVYQVAAGACRYAAADALADSARPSVPAALGQRPTLQAAWPLPEGRLRPPPPALRSAPPMAAPGFARRSKSVCPRERAQEALAARRLIGAVLAGLSAVLDEFVAFSGRYSDARHAQGVSIKVASDLYKPSPLRMAGIRAPYVPATNSSTTAAQRKEEACTDETKRNDGSESFHPVSVKSKATWPRSVHTMKEIYMQTNQNHTAPMVRCDGRGATRRKSIEELLAEVRVTHPDWFARFEDAHLSVVASADLMEVVELIATSPSERLAGIVEGMYLNN